MAIIAPFRGLTYDFTTGQDLSSLVAPPYDVISEPEQEAYYQADPYNVIRLILGGKKIGDSDWDNRYTRSADFFKRWESAPDFQLQPFLEKIEKWFNILKFSFSSPDLTQQCSALKEKLAEVGRSNSVMAFYHQKADECYLFSLKPGAREKMGDDLHRSCEGNCQ
jgi:hypothetical protein